MIRTGRNHADSSAHLSPAAVPPAQGAFASGNSDFAFIDWLRGIAALLVVYFHFDLYVLHQYPATPIPPGSFTDLFVFGHFDLGKYAVGVFFMVSGFLIPSTLTGANASLRRFATHRFFRLYPAYWLSLLVFVAVEYASGRASALSWPALLVNVTMLQNLFGVPDALGVYWTLLIELIFYAACAFLFLIGRLHDRETTVLITLAAGLGCAAWRYTSGAMLPVALFIALALMFVGDALRAYADGRTDMSRVVRLTALTAITLLPICLLSYGANAPRYVLTYWVAAGTFLAMFSLRARIGRTAGAKHIGRFLADCSYSVYLLHGPIGMTLATLVYVRSGNAVLAALAMFGSTLSAAYASFRLVEAPGVRLGRSMDQPAFDPTRPAAHPGNQPDR